MNEQIKALQALKKQNAIAQKRGIHFLLTAVIILAVILGLVFTCNQIVFMLIPMWAMYEAPQHMLMLYLIIFGAHLLPYGWLYHSRSYILFSLLISLAAFLLGLTGNQILMAGAVLLLQIGFCICILRENSREKEDN